MGFNKYTVQIIIRVILIFITLIGAVYFIPRPNRAVTAIFFVLLAISQLIFLIRFFNSINRDLARFLIELKEQDSSEIFFPEKLEKNFKNLRYSFQQILDEIKKSRIEKVSQKHYLEYIVENISDGLISFDEDGKIKIINISAKKLLGVQFLTSIWDIDKIKIGLAKKLVLAKPGSNELVKLSIDNQDYNFLFRVSEVKIESEILKIITFQDLKRELDEKEISSWKKLMRVLTHEMMNSLTPITTLSVAIRRILKKDQNVKSKDELESEDLNDIYKNNETIENRSKGLLGFLNQYRQITKIPVLQKEEVELIPFLKDIQHLFSEEIEKNHVKFSIECEHNKVWVKIDKKQIEHVFINLIKNSLEAVELKDKKEIKIKILAENEWILIQISDNGMGINSEIKEDVFIPFFTTKQNGSGIGLSLSKEIMQKHKGEIYFETKPEKGTTFYLKFPV